MRGKIITIGILSILIGTVFIPITLGHKNNIDEDLNSLVESTYNRYDGTKQNLHLKLTAMEPPHANFTYSANGKNVFFDASSSYDNDGNIVSYDWDFGDGEIGSGKFVNYTYCCFDTYTIKLNVTDNDGLTNETSKIITIFNDPPFSPNDPEPENNSINIDINTIISWTCVDPNGDPITYDVYFEKDDANPDDLVSENQSYPYYSPSNSLEYDSHYYWQIVAWDSYEAGASGPIWHFLTGSAPNNPPDQPGDPTPINGSFNVEIDILLSWICSDPDDDDLVYDIYLEADDTTPDVLVSDDQYETTFNTEALQYKTDYYWQIIVKDEHGASTVGPVWNFKTQPEKNDPPSITLINGPAIGNIKSYIVYTFVAKDPDDDEIFYEVDWGDGRVDPWIGPYQSNKVITSGHKWGYWGVYTIKARAKDIYGEVGDWGDLVVTMPRSKIVANNLFFNLFTRLSNQFPIIRLLIQKIGI
jgi:PKD repeat protein